MSNYSENRQIHLKSYGIKECNLLVLMVIAGLMVGYILRNETNITYSRDNFLKVETSFGKIKEVERGTFDRARRELGLRPYFSCNEISNYEEILNNQN